MGYDPVNEEVLKISEDQEHMMSTVGAIQYNIMSEEDPAYFKRTANAMYLANLHGKDFEDVLNNYKEFAVASGYSGDETEDNMSIVGEIKKNRDRTGFKVEAEAQGWVGSAAAAGAVQAASSMVRGSATQGFIAANTVEENLGMGASGDGTFGVLGADFERFLGIETKGRRLRRESEAEIGELREQAAPIDVGGGFFEIQIEAQEALKKSVSERGMAVERMKKEEWGNSMSKGLSDLTLRIDEGTKEALGVNDEYLGSLKGIIASGAGGLPVYLLAAVSGAPGLVALQAAGFDEVIQDYTQVQKEKGGSTDPRDAFAAAASYGMMSAALERVGLDTILGKIFLKNTAFSGWGFAKRVLVASQSEGLVEAAQGHLLDTMAKISYDDERQLWTKDAAKKRLTEYFAGAVIGGGASGIIGGKQWRDQRKIEKEIDSSTETADLFSEFTEGFKAISSMPNGDPMTTADWKLKAEVVTKEDIDLSLKTEYEKDIVTRALEGDAEAQTIAAQIIQDAKDGFIEFTPPRVIEGQKELLQITEGIKSAESEIESNANVREDANDFPIRPGDVRDGDPVDVRQEKEAQRKLEREARAELDELNTILEEQFGDKTPPDPEEKIPKRINTAVSKVLSHLSGEKRLSPTQLAKYRATVRENIAGTKELARQLARFERKDFSRLEQLSRLEERLVQQKNDAKLKLQLAIKKKDAFYAKRIDAIKQKGHDKAREEQLLTKEIRDSIRDTEKLISSMPADFRAKFPRLGRMADVRTIAGLMKTEAAIKQQIERIYVEESRKAVLSSVAKEVKTVKDQFDKASGRGGKFKFGPETIRFIDLAGLGDRSVRDAAQAKYDELIGRIESMEEGEIYQKTKADEQTAAEALIPDMANPDRHGLDELRVFLSDLKSVKKDGVTEFEMKKRERSDKNTAQANKITNKIAARNSKRKGDLLSPDDIAYERGISKMAGSVNKQLLDPRSVNAILTGETKGPLKKLLDRIADGLSVSIVKHKEYSGFVKETAKRHGVDLFKSGAIPLPNVEAGGKRISMYEAMFVYGHSQNPIGLEHLKNTVLNGKKIDILIDDIIENLPDSHKDFVDSMIDYNDTVMYPRLNELHMEMHGVPMAKEDRYLPVTNISSSSAFDIAMTSNPAFMRMHMAFMKNRTGGIKGFRSFDLIGSLEANNSSAEHAMALHSTLADTKAILDNKDLQAEMLKADADIVSYLREFIKDVALGEINKPKNAFVRVLRIARNNVRTYWLAVNPGSWLKTQAPIFSAAREIEKGYLAAAMSSHFSRSNWNVAREKSMFMRGRPHTNRIERMEVANRQFLASKMGLVGSSTARVRELHRWTQDRAYFMYDPLDLAATSTTWVAKYSEQMNKHGREDVAIRAADDVIKKHFPSGRVDELPPIFRDNGLLKEFTIFTADMNRMYNLGFSSQQLKTKKVRNAFAFAFYSVFMASAYLAFTDMAQDSFRELLGIKDAPEEDERGIQFLRDTSRYMASQVVGGIPVIGKTIEATVATATGERNLSRLMAAQTPISLYPASMAMKGNYFEAAAAGAGIPAANVLIPMIEDYISTDEDEGNWYD